jgi:hypothetical protein
MNEIERLKKENEWLREIISGCLHFDDAYIGDGPLGRGLIGWLKEARRITEGGKFPHET